MSGVTAAFRIQRSGVSGTAGTPCPGRSGECPKMGLGSSCNFAFFTASLPRRETGAGLARILASEWSIARAGEARRGDRVQRVEKVGKDSL